MSWYGSAIRRMIHAQDEGNGSERGVTLLLVVIFTVLSSGGRYYFTEVEWKRVNSIPYSEAQKC